MAAAPVDIQGKKILITGPTGQVAEPVVAAWAKHCDLYALARFSKDEDHKRIEALGATCLAVDLSDPDGLVVPDHTISPCTVCSL